MASQARSVSMSEAALISGLERVIPGYVRESNPNLVDLLKDEILDKYVVIDKAEIVKNTFQTVSLKFPGVKRGDLITADLMNAIIGAIENLDERVTTLESGAVSDDAVVITRLVPEDGIVKVGEELQVLGRNFGISQLSCQVFIDNEQVFGFKQGTSDTKLIFDVPLTIVDVPSDGRPATLTVHNQNSSAERTLTLKSAMTLQGPIDVILQGFKPESSNTPTPGAPITYEFLLRSRTNLDAVYTIYPRISVSENATNWNSGLQVLDSTETVIADKKIQLDPGKEKTFFVRINPVPTGTNGVAYSLTVDASSGNVFGSSGLLLATVGTPIPKPDNTISLVVSGSSEIKPPGSIGSVTKTKISLALGTAAKVVFNATFEVAGNYDLEGVLVPPAQGWLVEPTALTPSPLPIEQSEIGADGTAAKIIEFSVGPYPDQNPSTTGFIMFEVRRQGSDSSRTYPMEFQILT